MAARYACAWPRPTRAALVASHAHSCEPMTAVALLGRRARRSAARSKRSLRAACRRRPRRRSSRRRGTRLRVGYLSTDFHDHATAHLAAGLFECHDRAPLRDVRVRRRRRRRQRRCAGGCAPRSSTGATCASSPTPRPRAGSPTTRSTCWSTSRATRAGRGCACSRIARRRCSSTTWASRARSRTARVDAHRRRRRRRAARQRRRVRGARAARCPCATRSTTTAACCRRAVARGGGAAGARPRARVLQPDVQADRAVRAGVARGAARARRRRAVAHGAARARAPQPRRCSRRNPASTPRRVVFAPMVAQAAHLARLRCADLALDVLPYGSHTTGSDALFAGVPLLTCRGTTFAGRVGASLCNAAGLERARRGVACRTTRRGLRALCADRAQLAH